MTEGDHAERRLELVSTVLLALATVATAWSAYQARQWTGVQSQSYSKATTNRIAENRYSALANRQVQIDVATFIQWVDAHEHHDTALADFYRERFRDEFQPAFAAWLATRPFADARAPKTPFAMPQYRLQDSARADSLELTAAGFSERAGIANQHADNYTLAVVLFASSLFFAGISTKLKTFRCSYRDPGPRLPALPRDRDLARDAARAGEYLASGARPPRPGLANAEICDRLVISEATTNHGSYVVSSITLPSGSEK